MTQTFEQVKAEYLNENFEYVLATADQVDELSDWLDANDLHNYAHMRWEAYQEEMRMLRAEIDWVRRVTLRGYPTKPNWKPWKG